MVSAIGWARTNGMKIFLGEVGVSQDPQNTQGTLELHDMLAYMYASRDVVLGYTYWGAGPAWGNGYIYVVEPFNPTNANEGGWAFTPYGERPQMGVMRMFL